MKALMMTKFPLPEQPKRTLHLGHPVRLCGKKGKRLRGKSRTRTKEREATGR
jgi:hypothetical protein